MQRSQPPADWVRAGATWRPRSARARRRRSLAGRSSCRRILRPEELEKLPEPQRTAPAGDREPAAPSAAAEPAAPRASHLEVPAPPQRRAKRSDAGDSGGSRPLRGEGSEAPAAETPVVGDDLLPGRRIPAQRVEPSDRAGGCCSTTRRRRSRCVLRSPSSRRPPTPRRRCLRRRPTRSVPHPPFRSGCPRRSAPMPRRRGSIGRICVQIDPGVAAERASHRPALAEDDARLSFASLAGPSSIRPRNAGPDMEVALRKWERDLQVAREQSRL